ncbi:acyl-CoA dehydrogenase family protein [Corynebacterium propinquum]|uniref:acyl-CoA dehydrogenase family protein n=1 Tax=Corynebacterium propinquum TaxID=43769 RepID=UPI0032B1165E
MRPQVTDYWDREEFPFDLLGQIAEYGLGEIEISGTSRLFRGLVYAKITCADVSLATLVDIHNELIVGGLSMTATRTEKDWIIAGVSPEKISGKLGLRIM